MRIFFTRAGLKLRNYDLNKAKLQQEGILFHTQIPSLGIFINKKMGFQKTKAT